jgi:hypothetical protein
MPNSRREFVVSPRSVRGFFLHRVFVVSSFVAVIGAGWGLWQPLNVWADTIAQRVTANQSSASIQDHSGAVAQASQSFQIERPTSPRIEQERVPSPVNRNAARASSSETGMAEIQPAPTTSTPRSQFYYQLTVSDQSYSFQHDASLTVLELMQQLADQGFRFTSERLDLGVFITSLNDDANDPLARRYWMYTVNGHLAAVGVDQYQLQDRDVVAWRYTQL